MIRQAPRLLSRRLISLHAPPTHRFLSTAPPAQKSRSWKSSAARWGLAIGAIYYYNTSSLFAEEPPFSIPPADTPTEETSLPTLESVTQEHRARTAQQQNPPPTSEGLEATEEEASQEGAFNEETGEINWECPCLGGMAHGSCGEQFRAAFSCFVFSKEEPKGMDCIDNFKNMQTCFREHPDEYGAELEGDDEPEDGSVAPEGEGLAAPVVQTEAVPPSTPQTTSMASGDSDGKDTHRAQAAKEHMETNHPEPTSESDDLIPKAAYDATSANAGR